MEVEHVRDLCCRNTTSLVQISRCELIFSLLVFFVPLSFFFLFLRFHHGHLLLLSHLLLSFFFIYPQHVNTARGAAAVAAVAAGAAGATTGAAMTTGGTTTAGATTAMATRALTATMTALATATATASATAMVAATARRCPAPTLSCSGFVSSFPLTTTYHHETFNP